jgi:hypothetical protein
MAVDASAYAALGLDPGADAASVEQAYKRLIKQYHPDREGGDSKRAAEINRAYRELRHADAKDEFVVAAINEENVSRCGGRWASAALPAGLVMAAFALFFGATSRPSWMLLPEGQAGRATTVANSVNMLEQPVASAAITEAVQKAVSIARTEDEMALATASLDCHRALRLNTSLTQLDRCAAFDDAVVQLQDRDPLRDQGPFSELAVTGRQMSSATIFSDDYVAIDGRLDRIRLQVELALARITEPSNATLDQR